MVDLRDLVNGEVLRVGAAGELGLEGSTDLAETVPVDAMEEGMLLELQGAASVT